MVKIGYYGNFTTSFNTEVYIADALERGGFTVIRMNINESTLIDCDYFLCAKLYKNDLIIEAKKKGIPSISWSFDLYKGLYGYDYPHLKADVVITTDPNDVFYTIRQAINKSEKIEIPGKKIYDVVFIGSMHYQKRRDVMKRVKPIIFNNKRGLGLNKLLGQSKIAFGDSYPSQGSYWSNRLYEMTGRGGFFIHPKTKDMPEYIPQFERGKEMETINYYLKHENEREELRKIQFKNCPTYDDRIKEFKKLISDVL